MQNLQIDRIKNDSNGNPRYVVHYLNLLTEEEMQESGDKYTLALYKSKKIGGKKYHNKSYGGGIAFVTYDLERLIKDILEMQGGVR
jgi:hypothetical protein